MCKWFGKMEIRWKNSEKILSAREMGWWPATRCTRAGPYRHTGLPALRHQ